MAKRGRPVSRYFMEQWTTNREMVKDDFASLDRKEFIKKYGISPRKYVLYNKKICHRDNKDREYSFLMNERVKLFPGTPRDAIEYIQAFGITAFDKEFGTFSTTRK